MDRCMRRGRSWVCYLLYFVFLVFCLVMPAEATESKTVRVGWFEDSYNITDETGQRRGYGYEFQQAVASYTGWQYEYIQGNWSDLFAMLKKGDIDMMCDISYTDERASQLLFAHLPMGEQHYYLYVNLTDTGIRPFQLGSLNGKRVGILAGGIHEAMFSAWEKENGVETQYVPILGLADGVKKLENRDIDGLVFAETPELTERGMFAMAAVGNANIYFAFSPNRPDLKEDLDVAMKQLESDNPFFADELYKRYLSSVMPPVLSTVEKLWLAQHGPIRVGWVAQDYGISEGKASGKPVGIINDYVKFAESSLEQQILPFELVGFSSITEEVEALKDGKIDMIFHFPDNPYLAEQYGMSLSHSAIPLNMVAMTKQEAFNEKNKNRVAVKKGNLLANGYISYNYPQWKIQEYDTWEAAEKAVKNGDADCYIAKAGWAARKTDDHALHSVMLMQSNQLAFAVDHRNTELLSILNKTIKVLPSAMLPSALSMYANSARKVTVVDFVKDNLLSVSLGIGTMVVLVFVAIISALQQSRKAEKVAKEAARQSSELNKKLQENHEALENALLLAKQASEAKTTFLFNMSHDIRTPMNALLGYAKLIKQELTDTKLLGYEQKMEQAGNLLLSIINNVLDMARIESGKMELDESYNRVGTILDDVYSVFAVEAKKKNIDFTLDIQAEHHHILCDSTKTEEIFANLVSNAIKYTPAGGSIRIQSREIPCDKEGYVRFRTDIIDTGIGMSADYLPHIFESFSRERNSTLAKVSGTGLGMAIVKKLIDMMGGTLEVTSELGKGSTFTVTLTHRMADKVYYEKVETAAPDAHMIEKLKGKHILLAEDNDLNAEIAILMLEQIGLQVERVEDGIQCVNQMEKEPAGTYDLILMDVQMPKMDGYHATHAIRRFADKKKANIPIIAMTANAFEEDRKMAIKQGMNGHIAKPIDVEKVERVLISFLK